MNPVVLIDTYSLLFRAHYALPPMSTAAGEPTAALYGFCALLLKLLRERRPRGLAFAVDAPGGSFRRREYGDYKAGRPETPSELGSQLARLPRLYDACGAPSFAAAGFEADDVLATLAAELAGEEEVLVVSGDRDLLQLTARGVRVLFVGRRGREPVLYDQSAVEARFGVPVELLATYVALVGDPADNLPGLAGVGPKTAARWVRQLGRAEVLLEHVAELRPERLQPVVAQHREQIVRNERLATLRRDVPLGGGPRFRPCDEARRGSLDRLFAELEFESLRGRLGAIRLWPFEP